MTKHVHTKTAFYLTMIALGGIGFPLVASAQGGEANPIPMMAAAPGADQAQDQTSAAPDQMPPQPAAPAAPAAAPEAAETQSPPAQQDVAVPAPKTLGQALASQITDIAEDQKANEPKPAPEAKAPSAGELQPPTPLAIPDMAAPTDVPGVDQAAVQDQPAQNSEVDAMRQEAFEAMMTGMLPLDPPQIREALTRMDRNQKAMQEPLAYPKPELTFTTISLDPGSTPLTFKLATGHVTTVTFLDVTGEPWPIKDVSWAGDFEVKAPTNDNPDDKFYLPPNVLRIIPLGEYAYGNVSMRLVGLPTPVTFTLRTGRETVQYRLDIRIPEMGPFAQPPLIEGGVTGLTAGDATLTQVMEGVAPPAAEKLEVSGVDGRTSVYRIGGLVYVRTPLTLLSPGWSGSVRSADGMNVYAINSAPVLLLSDEGRMVRAHVTDTAASEEDE